MAIHAGAAEFPVTGIDPINPPAIGSHGLTIASPTVLELALITTKPLGAPRPVEWDFVTEKYELELPPAKEFEVSVAGKPAAVKSVGFKRRVLYAPLKKRDLRIGNWLYLELEQPVPDGARVEVRNPSGKLWKPALSFKAVASPLRWSPAIHVNQVGYVPGFPKRAMVGMYLGSAGEMRIGPDSLTFKLVDASSGKPVHDGKLRLRRDVGFTFPCYQNVVEADFTEFKTPGEYRLHVPGLGVSLPFWIDDGVAGAFARTYALGLYHQRCGTANELPFTRFTHGPCHSAPADVPTPKFGAVQHVLSSETSEAKKDPKHTAPQLKGVEASLYPFGRQGRIDVAGGHHDAGDYSKYTINSAQLIHHLVFAADVLPGVGALDNMGLPESGDGKSDILQEAKWEADFLAKMQDTDGGFYFLVYPRERRYEDDVPPDKGDPQVIFPKNTAATAAAVAALAQTASSPLFKRQFQRESAFYLEKAFRGWDFLQKAIAKHGRDGAYQKFTHYGNEFRHEDELTWAATELYLATGDAKFKPHFMQFDPESRDTKRWTWWRMYEAYGSAIRSYAFGAKTGRLKENQLDTAYLAKCRAEVLAAANDQIRFARDSAYGTSFPDPTKRFRSAGWYFSLDRAFDIAAAWQLDFPEQNSPRAEFLDAIVSNLNYEAGCNPVDVSYITGLGWKQPRDVVHQHAQNDRRVLPPSGLPLGNVQAGFQFLHHYEKELGQLSFPPDGAEDSPYPFYDRWGDSFNVSTEFVVLNQARALATTALLFAQTPAAKQAWRATVGEIVGLPKDVRAGKTTKLSFRAKDVDLTRSRTVWEAADLEPFFGPAFEFTPLTNGPAWVEVEAHLPDGRRVSASQEFTVLPAATGETP